MGCERSDSFHASGCGKCFWPPCFGFLGTVPGLSQRHESKRSRLALTCWWVSGERQQSPACVPESLPPAHAVCPDPINPSTLSSRRSAASFYAVSVPFSSESCCPCSDPLPSDARLVFQPCQTWFVFEVFKKMSNWNLVTLFDRFSLDARACLFDILTPPGQLGPRLGPKLFPPYRTNVQPRCADVSHVNICYIPVFPLRRYDATARRSWGGRDFPPSFRRDCSSFCTWFSHLPENSNEMQMSRRCRATWGNNTNLYHGG